MSEWASDRLYRNHERKVRDANREWERAWERMREQGPDMETIDLADASPDMKDAYHGDMKDAYHGDIKDAYHGEMKPEYGRDPRMPSRPEYGRHRSSNEMMAEYFSGLTKEEFGWTLEEKYNQIKPQERYLPLIMEASRSKQFEAYA
jgi:hypothetical protein